MLMLINLSSMFPAYLSAGGENFPFLLIQFPAWCILLDSLSHCEEFKCPQESGDQIADSKVMLSV